MTSKTQSLFNKSDQYYSEEREDIVSLIEGIGNTILEIGCGNGNTGRLLKQQNRVCYLVGIEINNNMALLADKVFDKVSCGDVEKIDLPIDYGLYDYIICGDVLEHLIAPWNVLKKIFPVLKQHGCIIASIPTVRNWRVVRDLLFKGEFYYREHGILDITHLRFFTKSTIRNLFEENNFKVEKLEPSPLGIKASLINKVTLGLFEEFLTIRYLIKAKKL